MIEALLDGQRDKIVSAADAVRLIRPGDTVATGGFVGIGFAEAIAVALEALYLDDDDAQAASRPAERPDAAVCAAARATARSAA